MAISSVGIGAGVELAKQIAQQSIQPNQIGAAAQALAQQASPAPSGPPDVAEKSGGHAADSAGDPPPDPNSNGVDITV